MSVDEINPEVVEQLKKSAKLRGPIEKVVLNAEGKLVDGHQRKAADPDWPEEVNETLKTEEDCVLFDVDKNWHRTSKSDAWKRSRIEKLARLGNSAKQVSEKTGLPDYTVYRYYPAELKDQRKVEAGKVGGEARALACTVQAESEDLREAEEKAKAVIVECANCHLGFRIELVKYVDGKPYCPGCVASASVAYQNEQKRQKKAEEESAKSTMMKPHDYLKYEEKEAERHPKESEMDKVLHIKAQSDPFILNGGWKVEFQKVYTATIVICKSDLTLTRGTSEIMCFWDGEDVHPDPEGDLEKRQRAQKELKEHGISAEILPIRYKRYSPKEADRLWKETLAFIEELEKWETKGGEATEES